MKLIDNYKDEVKKAITLLKELSSLNVINKEKIILATNYIKDLILQKSILTSLITFLLNLLVLRQVIGDLVIMVL